MYQGAAARSLLVGDAGIGGLTKADYRLLHELLQHLEFGNLVTVPRSELARALGMDRANVSRSFRTLKAAAVVLPTTSAAPGRARTYMVNPDVAFKGDEVARPAARRKFRQLRAGLSLV